MLFLSSAIDTCKGKGGKGFNSSVWKKACLSSIPLMKSSVFLDKFHYNKGFKTSLLL